VDAFEDLADLYDALIDWPKRLANEEPFYRALFERVGARSVLDVACGTGRHAAQYHAWGLRAAGSDMSPAMIERCQREFGESEGLSWAVRPFDQPHPRGFDVVICVGNSLSLAPDLKTVQRAVTQMLTAVRPGGACALQVLNLWHLRRAEVQARRAGRPGARAGQGCPSRRRARLRGIDRSRSGDRRRYADFQFQILSGPGAGFPGVRRERGRGR
jgi:SAM-dependent methyltransferase